MNKERREYRYLWFIENYCYCWHKNGEALMSPEFTADGLEGTVWKLELFPRGYDDNDKGYISIFLNRCKSLTDPENFKLKFELAVLRSDGLAPKFIEFENTFSRGDGYGRPKFIQMDEVLVQRKVEYLPHDTLSVQCRMWKEAGEILPVTQICARTRIIIEDISFLHVIERFSILKLNQKTTIQIRSPTKTTPVLSSSVYFTDGSCCEEKIMVENTPFGSNQILSRCKLSLLDASGKLIQCGEADNRFDAARKNIKKFPLSLARQVILNGKSKYLPGDKMTLVCECTLSTGDVFEKIEKTLLELPLMILNKINNFDMDKGIYAKQLSAYSSALDDFKAVFNNKLLADLELKTKTKSFPAHKIVLCARSSVFEAMLTNDMKENNTKCIQVDDLENDIVQQLLLFLYSDNLENLKWESATKLYYAADKYAIGKLKVLCSAFLIDNVTTAIASELLLLADTHNDSDLKNAVEDFIFKHEEEVFGSNEWGNLIETNPVLVSKTMCLKYKR